MAAFISSLEVSQIQLKKGFSDSDLKTELSSLYLKTGLKNVGIMFLMTDAQIPNEQFLVLINDMLASGEVPDMFPDDEIENIIAGVRNEVKGAGMLDTRENCWKFFIDRVRKQLKVVLCFSPVGSTLRIRSRKFPAIINCTQINWFHEWPQEALISVSLRFLQELKALPVRKDALLRHVFQFRLLSCFNICLWFYDVIGRVSAAYCFLQTKCFIQLLLIYSSIFIFIRSFNIRLYFDESLFGEFNALSR